MVMRWKNQSESVLHEETDTCEDLLLKVQNLYIKNAIIISVYFDIPPVISSYCGRLRK